MVRFLMSVVATVKESIRHRALVLFSFDRDGDWHIDLVVTQVPDPLVGGARGLALSGTTPPAHERDRVL